MRCQLSAARIRLTLDRDVSPCSRLLTHRNSLGCGHLAPPTKGFGATHSEMPPRRLMNGRALVISLSVVQRSHDECPGHKAVASRFRGSELSQRDLAG
jgi:hypothetical protein